MTETVKAPAAPNESAAAFNPGLFVIALKLLVNDQTKFYSVVIGITFAVFLILQMTSMFAGILQRSSATVANVGASIWVMDPGVQTVSSSIPIPAYVQDAVRSLDGVRYAVPLYLGGGQVKLPTGVYQGVTIIGLDDTSLYGRPDLTQGKIEDVYGEDGFIVVADAEYRKLNSPALGSVFEINEHRAVIVGIAKVSSNGLFGVPTLYTTYSRAANLPRASLVRRGERTPWRVSTITSFSSLSGSPARAGHDTASATVKSTLPRRRIRLKRWQGRGRRLMVIPGGGWR